MRRKQFLIEFLGALGAKEIQWQKETDASISGTVIYEIDDPEEVQEDADIQKPFAHIDTYMNDRFTLFQVCHGDSSLLNSGSKPIRLFELNNGSVQRPRLLTIF